MRNETDLSYGPKSKYFLQFRFGTIDTGDKATTFLQFCIITFRVSYCFVYMYYQLDARYYIYLFGWNFGVHTAVSMFIFMSVSSSQQSLCPCGQHNWGSTPSPYHHPRKIQSQDNRVTIYLTFAAVAVIEGSQSSGLNLPAYLPVIHPAPGSRRMDI